MHFQQFHLLLTYVPCAGSFLEEGGLKFESKRRLFDLEIARTIDVLQTSAPVVWIGDHNVVRSEMDVYDGLYNPDRWMFPSCTIGERTRFEALLMTRQLIDVSDFQTPLASLNDSTSRSRRYTFFEYSKRKSLKGLRIDLVVASKCLLDENSGLNLGPVTVQQTVIGSDHVPVTFLLKGDFDFDIGLSQKVPETCVSRIGGASSSRFVRSCTIGAQANMVSKFSLVNRFSYVDKKSEDVAGVVAASVITMTREPLTSDDFDEPDLSHRLVQISDALVRDQLLISQEVERSSLVASLGALMTVDGEMGGLSSRLPQLCRHSLGDDIATTLMASSSDSVSRSTALHAASVIVDDWVDSMEVGDTNDFPLIEEDILIDCVDNKCVTCSVASTALCSSCQIASMSTNVVSDSMAWGVPIISTQCRLPKGDSVVSEQDMILQVSQTQVSGMIDTGAIPSLIDLPTLNNRFGNAWHYEQVDVLPVFVTANNGRARALGCVRIQVLLCEEFRELIFWVLPSVPNGMIVGFSALKQLGATIYCGTNQLKIGDQTQEFRSDDLGSSLPERRNAGAFLKSDVCVSAMDWAIVPITTGSYYPKSGDFSVFVSDYPFSQKAMVAKGPSYLKDGHMRVLIFNSADTPLFLRRGKRVATVLPYADEDYYHSVFDVQSSPSSTIDPSSIDLSNSDLNSNSSCSCPSGIDRMCAVHSSREGELSDRRSDSSVSHELLTREAEEERLRSLALESVRVIRSLSASMPVANSVSVSPPDCACDPEPVTVGAATSVGSSTVDDIKLDENGLPVDLPTEQFERLWGKTKAGELTAFLAGHAGALFMKDYKKPSAVSNFQLSRFELIDENVTPQAVAARRVTPAQRQIMTEYIDQLLAAGIIVPSTSPWSAAVVLVRKKDGDYRVAIDYRLLNACLKNVHPNLPRTDDILDSLGGNGVFSCMDLCSGFWQLPLHSDDQELTAFSCPDGSFEFTRLPQGLKTSPALFSRFMNMVTAGLRFQCCLVFIDDVIVYSKDFDSHLEDLESLFRRFKKYNIRLKASKCFFAMDEVVYLGHLVSLKGIKPDPSKISAIDKMPIPTDLSGVRSFLGLVSYYRKFIPHFSAIAAPLRLLLKKNAKFPKHGLMGEQLVAFNTLREMLMADNFLVFPDFSKPLIVETDGGPDGLGAVLTTLVDGEERPCQFISRSLTDNERGYVQYDRELLALTWALDVFRHYLIGVKFVVRTDNQALTYLKQKKNYSRHIKWVIAMQEYDFDLQHRKGKHHVVPDGLSRLSQRCVRPYFSTVVGPCASGHSGEASAAVLLTSVVALFDQSKLIMPVVTRSRAKQSGSIETTDDVGDGCDVRDVRDVIIVDDDLDHKHSIDGVNDHADVDDLISNATVDGIMVDDSVSIGDDSCSEKESLRVTFSNAIDYSFKRSYCDLTSDIKGLFRQHQRGDPRLSSIVRVLRLKETSLKVINLKKMFLLEEGLLWYQPLPLRGVKRKRVGMITTNSKRRKRLVVPVSLVESVLYFHHGLPMSGHLGRKKMTDLVCSRFYWKGVTRDIRKWIRACVPCVRRKTPRPLRVGTPLSMTVDGPFERVAFDLVGPFAETRSGNVWVLTMIDSFLRWPIAIALPNKSAVVVAQAIYDWLISQHACPKQLLSDLDPSFVGKVVTCLCDRAGIERIVTTGYQPQANPHVERWHRYMNAALTIAINRNKDDWDEVLQAVVFVFRISVHSSTGVSPFMALYGREPTLPWDLFATDIDGCRDELDYYNNLSSRLQDVYGDMRRVQEEAATANRNRRLKMKLRSPVYKPGDFVFYWQPCRSDDKMADGKFIKKVSFQWTGPFVVKCLLKDRPNNLILLTSSTEEINANVNRLYHFFPWYDDQPSIVGNKPVKLRALKLRGISPARYSNPDRILMIGDLVIFPLEVDQDDGSNPFGLGKLLSIQPDALVVQWHSNYRELLLGTYRPGWINKKGRHYYSSKPEDKSHRKYTNIVSDTHLSKDNVVIFGFSLTMKDTLPPSLLQAISDNVHISWTVPTDSH
jgi:hypothetical protein